MNPKQRLLEIYAAMPEQTRSIAGAVRMFCAEYCASEKKDELDLEEVEQTIQFAEAAWQIGVWTGRKWASDTMDAQHIRIRDLESREAEAEPVAYMTPTNLFDDTISEPIPLFRLKSPPSPTPLSVAGTSPQQSADGGTISETSDIK